MGNGWVLPDVCPLCDRKVSVLVMLIICAYCGVAFIDYEFVSEWRQRVNADTLALWEIT